MSDDGLKRARYSDVERRLWNDARFRRLSPIPPSGQGLWLYLLTTPELGAMPGLIVMGEAAMAEHLRWPLKGFREAFDEVLAEGMVEADWDARLVILPKVISNRKPESPNVVISWRQQWMETPECELKVRYFHILKAFVEGLAEGFRVAFAKAIAEPSPNQKQKQKQEQKQEEQIQQAAPVARPNVEEPAPSAKAKRGTRLPDDWQPDPGDYRKTADEFGLTEDDVRRIADEFRDYWRGVPGQKGTKLDWPATFRNRLREVGERRRSRAQQLPFARGGTPPVQPTAKERAWNMPKEES